MHKVKVYGPPGTGKTTYLIGSVDNWIKSGNRQDQVGFVTFTRTARAEALNRLGGNEDEWDHVRTLHALCYRNLKISNSRMVSRNDLRKFGDLVGVEIHGEGEKIEDENEIRELPLGDRLLRLNHVGRHRLLSLNQALAVLPVDVDEELAKHFTVSYREWKERERILDYTDLLTEYLKRGRPFNDKLFIVDEAQDLSPLQWQVVSKMGANAEYFFTAGDDDQAIYTWAGATAEDFNKWPADKIEVLPQSYRLPVAVHKVCQQVLERIEDRQPKKFAARAEEGEVEETGLIPDFEGNEDAIFLYRFAHRGKELAKYLRYNNVPFGGALSILEKRDTAAALNALDKVHNTRTPDDRKALEALGAPADATEVWQLERAWYLDYLLGVYQRFGLKKMLNPSIQLMSIHQSKGREASTVVLDTTMSAASYDHLQQSPDDEHRVWYVGASRAKEKLIILQGTGRFQYAI